MAHGSRRTGEWTAANAAVMRDVAQYLDLTHAEIAERTGIARSTIGKIMSGQRAIDIEEHALIAEAIGMNALKLTAAALKRLPKGG